MFRKYQNVFRSRWRAAMWAFGVCLTAYCTVPSAEEGKDGGIVAAGRYAASTAGHEAVKPHPKNPWALDPEQPPS